MPTPVSATPTSTSAGPTRRALTATRPPAGVYLTPLSTRLMRIWASRTRSARTGGRSAGRSTTSPTSPLAARSEEHTSELQSPDHLVCRLLLEKKKKSSYFHRSANQVYAHHPASASSVARY